MPSGAAYWRPTKAGRDGGLYPGHEEPAAWARRGTLYPIHSFICFCVCSEVKCIDFLSFCRIRSDCEKRPRTMLSLPCRRSSLPLNYEKQKQRWPSKNCDRKYLSWALSGLGTCRLTHHFKWSRLLLFFNGSPIPDFLLRNKWSNQHSGAYIFHLQDEHTPETAPSSLDSTQSTPKKLLFWENNRSSSTANSNKSDELMTIRLREMEAVTELRELRVRLMELETQVNIICTIIALFLFYNLI